jgi:putative hydrolase of the HAD superfamily
VYADVAARFGVRAEPAELNRRFRYAWGTRQHFDHSRAAWFELVRQTFARHRRLPEEFFPAVYERFAEPEAWRVFDDVEPILETLAGRGMRLAVVSNWDERLEPLLRALRLHSRFEALAVSCTVGITKPAPAIFHHALGQLGVSPAAAMHVGDRACEDAEGARAAGMSAVLVHRDRGSVPPDGAIRSLGDLSALLD